MSIKNLKPSGNSGFVQGYFEPQNPDKKQHKYYPDFYMKTSATGEEGEIEWMVEIKPEAQIRKPLPPKTKSKKALNSYKFLAEQYVKNTDKYKYAQAWCESRNMRFIVLTEKTLK